MSFIVEQRNNRAHALGTFPGRWQSHKLLPKKDYGYNRGPEELLEIVWCTTLPDGTNDSISMLCSPKLTPASRFQESKLYGIVAAVNGGVVPPKIDLDSLIGKACRVQIGIKQKGSRGFSVVEKVLPPEPAANQQDTPRSVLDGPRESFTVEVTQ